MANKRQSWSHTQLETAVNAIRSKEMGYLKASKQFGVPKRTLERYVKNDSSSVAKIPLGRKPALPLSVEKELIKYCIALDEQYFGLRLKDIRHMAFELALKNNFKHPFSKSKMSAGKKWLKGFLLRHPMLSIRTPQSVSAARVIGFTKENVNKFFDIYESELAKIKYLPNRVYNVDETGITVVQHKHSKVISLKGKKQVYALTSLERGKLITVVTCMNACGHYIPPLIIFPRKNRLPELMDGTPPGSIDGYHSSGWIQTDIFTTWLRHFIQHTKPTKNDPVVLVLDGHYTHTRNIDVINMARKNHISIVCLPPHSTHKMQPLDVGFMFPLKTYYAQAIETWMRNNPGRLITNRQVGMLFGEAYQKAATIQNSVSAFKKTGLFPCNRHVFGDEHFRIHDSSKNPSPIVDCPDALHNDGENLISEANKENQNVSGNLSPVPGCSRDMQEQSDTDVMVSPFQIKPVPTITQKQNKSTRAKSANLITSSPYKKQMEDFLKRKKEKVMKIATKNKGRNKVTKKVVKRKILVKSSSEDDNDVIPYQSNGSSSENDDAECPYCAGLFSEDSHGEKWEKCQVCFKWAHVQCGEVKSKKFFCTICCPS